MNVGRERKRSLLLLTYASRNTNRNHRTKDQQPAAPFAFPGGDQDQTDQQYQGLYRCGRRRGAVRPDRVQQKALPPVGGKRSLPGWEFFAGSVFARARRAAEALPPVPEKCR